jgi:ubiquinone/menaquinone biosynthesis C-methylase UbiE
MPDEHTWADFFNARAALAALWPEPRGNVLELGCGYGTFTTEAARMTDGWVTALDIDPAMIDIVREKASAFGLANIVVRQCDMIEGDWGIQDASQSHVMIYNLLHLDEPVALLQRALRKLAPAGSLSVMHWRKDVDTPRGPSLAIRPTPEDCIEWLREAGAARTQMVDITDACPFHYGVIAWHRVFRL